MKVVSARAVLYGRPENTMRNIVAVAKKGEKITMLFLNWLNHKALIMSHTNVPRR